MVYVTISVFVVTNRKVENIKNEECATTFISLGGFGGVCVVGVGVWV